MKASFRTSVFYATIANVLYAAMQWGIITVIAKAGSLKLLGQYAYSMGVIAPVATLFSLNLRSLQIADFQARHSFADYFWARLSTVVASSLILVSLAPFIFQGTSARCLFAAVGLFRCLETLIDVTHGYFQKHDRMDLVFRSMLIRVGIGLCFFAFIVVAWKNLTGAFIALGIIVVAVTFCYDLPLIRQTAPSNRVNFSETWRLIARSFPLTIGLLFNSVQANAPRLVLKHYTSLEEVGVFAALSYFVAIGGTLLAALGGVASPRIAKFFSSGQIAEIRRLMFVILAFDLLVGFTLVVLMSTSSGFIFKLLLSKEIARFSNLGIWIGFAAAVSFVESHLGVLATSINLLAEQVPIQALRMITAIGLSLLLVPKFGVIGAFLSIIASLGLTAVLYSIMCLKALQRQEMAFESKLATIALPHV